MNHFEILANSVYGNTISDSTNLAKFIKALNDKGPQTVSYSICPNCKSIWLEKCIVDNCISVVKSKPDIYCT